MPIRWDPLLVRHLVAELEPLLVGAHLRAMRMESDTRDLVLFFREHTLVWRLHPHRGYPLLRAPSDPDPSDLTLRGRVVRVTAPPDERILVITCLPSRSGHPFFELMVELMGNQWNAIVAEGDARVIRHLLHTPRGSRRIESGHVYLPPSPSGRIGVDGDLDLRVWTDLIGPLPPEDKLRTLVREVAWTSSLNAPWILGDLLAEGTGAAPEAALEGGHSRWRSLLTAPAEPTLLEDRGGLQPYPYPLGHPPSTRVPTLLDAFARCADRDGSGDLSAILALSPDLSRRLAAAIRAATSRVERLELEQAALPDADAIRGIGDLILARFGSIPPGASEAIIPSFDGPPVVVQLDPSLPVHANASRYYERARRAERARERLPRLTETARAERGRLVDLEAAARNGLASPEQVEAALPPEGRRVSSPGGRLRALPYRTFRSSGGLEIRVGRGGKDNDALTFHESAPGDVWLHVRDAPGAHVILRWPGPGNPPARDLEEAAALAALHSKARTSASVPVGWTYRRYVRKPRGAPPGTVAPDRVSVVFVRPDPELLERLSGN